MRNILDLSHIINDDMPVYPGTPSTLINQVCWHKSHGFAESALSISSHVGTHIDVPYHILESAPTISDLPISSFIGTSFKIVCNKSNCNLISIIEAKIKLLGIPDFILIQTNWDIYWGKPNYLENYILPSLETFKYLSELKIQGVGVDTISIDPPGSESFEAHKLILGQNKIIIENLKDLAKLPDGLFEFFCLPLKIENGDGSPVRAIARLTD